MKHQPILRRARAPLLAATCLGASAAASAAPYKVFLDMSYSGNTWQAAAANDIKALATTPPYDKTVAFKTVISGTEIQHQISDLQSMIAAGANAILIYPLSPTALNRVIRQGCARKVLMFTYDATVTEPCAYNVSNITAHYGADSAQWMVNQMGGAGELVINHGVAGTAVTKVYDQQALGVFARYPAIRIVGDFYGNWNDATSQEGVSRILAAHPQLNAIWTVDGTYGSLQAVINARPDKLVVVAGQSNNGYRMLIADPAERKRGLKGLSSSAGPAVGGYAFKVMMEALTGTQTPTAHNIEYPLPWVEPESVKTCSGDLFVDGCNVFPPGKVPPLFIDTALDGTLLPEVGLSSAEGGTPTPGAQIKKLPPVRYADDLPGINCVHCTAPANWLAPRRVTPMPVPK